MQACTAYATNTCIFLQITCMYSLAIGIGYSLGYSFTIKSCWKFMANNVIDLTLDSLDSESELSSDDHLSQSLQSDMSDVVVLESEETKNNMQRFSTSDSEIELDESDKHSNAAESADTYFDCTSKKLFYGQDSTLPVYKWTRNKEHFSVEELGRILLTDFVSKEKICSTQPKLVHHNTAFVVDLSELDDNNDIRADENGVWKRKGSPIAYVSIHKNGPTKVIRRSTMGHHCHHFKLTRTYYHHCSSPDFHRIITTAYDSQGQIQRLAFVQYAFERQEHPIEIMPHGNSKGKQPFSRTKPSTISLLKQSMHTKPPKKALREIENIKGGVMGAKSGCDLPRNYKQVKNLKYLEKKSCKPSSSVKLSSIDILAQVMQMCKGSVESEEVFVRSVEGAPEPMCVLATNQQLVDIHRFCTRDPSSVLCIDPTFNLGPFYVTPTTYNNLLVETARGNNPILLGPVLIHQTKSFRPFHYLSSTLIRLKPELIDLKAFGTDGEPELIKAFGITFPKAVHLRCTNHMRQNIKDKLRTLNIPQNVSTEFMSDIFGKRNGTHFEAGLADAESELAFHKSLERVRAKWNNLEKSCTSNEKEPQFHTWFSTNKAKDFIQCVLPQVRRAAGCKNPATFFTTNSSESINHVIKQEVDWKESKLPQLIDSLKSIANDQSSQLEKAVLGRGEWHFTPQYESLMIAESCWFSQMSINAKKLHMKKVFSKNPFNALLIDECSTQATLNIDGKESTSILSVDFNDTGITSLAESTLQSIWRKAEALVASNSDIIKVPWSNDDKDRLVKSSSSSQPHLVTRDSKNNRLYRCDQNCPMFKGFNICSHVVATAHVTGDLRMFLDNLNGSCLPNITAIANHGMPSGAGRKGGVAKRKRKQNIPAIETRSVRQCIDSSTINDKSIMLASSAIARSQSNHSFSFQNNQTSSSAVYDLFQNSTTSHGHEAVSCKNFVVNSNTAPPISMASFSQHNNRNPFVLKLKTAHIKICQSCRKNYDGLNDTMGLVVARAEKRLVTNLATGIQFFGKESNSHYHLHLKCLQAADGSFRSGDLQIPDIVKQQLTSLQKVYLATCFQFIPSQLV